MASFIQYPAHARGCLLHHTIELVWRGRSHWSMFIVGGVCFVLVGLVNERCPRCVSLASQMLFSAVIITITELCAGIVLNLLFRLHIWDYSAMPYNLLGQICLLYTNLWFFLSLPAILLDDWLRWRWFKEERPRYHLF